MPSFPFDEEPGERKNTLSVYKGDKGAQIVVRHQQISLLLLSGGVDSTYVLAKLLRESDDIVLAHRVNLLTRENRNEAERAGCQRVVEYCRTNYRDFEFTESTIDHSSFSNQTRDSYLGAIEAGLVASSYVLDHGYNVDRWTIGGCWEEIECNGIDVELKRIDIMKTLFNLTCSQDKNPRYFQLPLVRKADEIRYLGEGLAGLCWYCRTPVYASDGTPANCNKCMTCKVVEKARQELKS